MLKINQAPMRILTFDGAQSWRDHFLRPIYDTAVFCFNSFVVRLLENSVAVAAPGAMGVVRSIRGRGFRF